MKKGPLYLMLRKGRRRQNGLLLSLKAGNHETQQRHSAAQPQPIPIAAIPSIAVGHDDPFNAKTLSRKVR